MRAEFTTRSTFKYHDKSDQNKLCYCHLALSLSFSLFFFSFTGPKSHPIRTSPSASPALPRKQVVTQVDTTSSAPPKSSH